MISRSTKGPRDVVARLEAVHAVRSMRLSQELRLLDGKETACKGALERLDQDDLLVRGHELAWAEARTRLKAGGGSLRALRDLAAERLFLTELLVEMQRRRQRLKEEEQRLATEREELAVRCVRLLLRKTRLEEHRTQQATERACSAERRYEDEVIHRSRESRPW